MRNITRLFFLFALAFGVLNANAQDYFHLQVTGSSEPFVTSVPPGYKLLITTDRNNPSDEKNDVMSATESLPFPVNFYGTDYSSYKVSDNGYLTFDVSQTTSNPNNTALPNASAPKNAIFAMWDDLELEQNGTYLFAVLNATVGTAPNRTHMVKWFQANHVDRPAELSELYYFSIVFHEQGGFDIIHEGRYKPSSAQEVTESGTIGIANSDGTKGYTVEGPNFPFPTTSSQTMTDDVVYSFVSGAQQNNDVRLVSIDIPTDVALTAGAVDFSAKLRNHGKVTVSNFDLNYTIDGGSVVTDNYNTSLSTGAFTTKTINTKWTPSAAGTYEVKFYSSNPNNVADEAPGNDTMTATVTVHETTYDRKPLYEVFTSSTCGPCRPGNENFHSVINGKEDQCVFIKYQQDFPGNGDPYASEESVDRRGYYGVNSIPRMEIDGGWDGNAGSFTSSLHNAAVSEFALFDINATFDKWDGSVVTYVEVDALVNRNDVSIYAAAIESVTDKNVASNGETEFTNVFKKWLAGANGDTYNATKGNKKTSTYQHDFLGSYTLPANGRQSNWVDHSSEHTVEDFSNIQVIVWVQDNATKKVLQAAYATEIKQSVNEVNGTVLADVHPNPTVGYTKLRLNLEHASDVRMSLVNAMGQEVNTMNFNAIASGERMFDLNLSEYNNGVYFLTIETDYGHTTKRIVVSK